MTITYKWKLTSFKKTNASNTLTNVIFQTHWEKIGTDEHGNTGRFTGATPFDPAQIDTKNFVRYESLKEETVLSWIKSKVTGEYEVHVNEHIAKEIAEKTNVHVEVHASSFPWAASTATGYVSPSPAPV